MSVDAFPDDHFEKLTKEYEKWRLRDTYSSIQDKNTNRSEKITQINSDWKAKTNSTSIYIINQIK